MEKQHPISLDPAKVFRNETLTVRSATANFEQRQYSISDESGRVIRTGLVNEYISEFKLCMVGLAAGVYSFKMGQVQQRFVIIN